LLLKHTQGGVTMVYNETYASGDVAEVSIDLIVGLGAALFSFISLIAIVVLIRILKGKKLM
jgi:hypothetical protein